MFISLSDLFDTVLDFFTGGLPFDKSKKNSKSPGQRLLPLSFRIMPIAVVSANIFLWLVVVLLIVWLVSVLS